MERHKNKYYNSEGKTIGILLDDKAVDYHFGKGQAIYGLVTRLNLE